ncbi:MAG: MbnP family protein [Bacteroidota bacterium]
MRIIRLLSLPSVVIILFLFSSCERKIETGNFTLQFKAKYGEQDFAINTPNTDPEGRRIKLELLRFYLSHITLIKNDNSEIELKDVALIDFSNPLSLSYNLDNISGDFKGIKFGAGLDSIQNLTDPSTIDDENPLGNQEMYWSWMKYIFEVLQAKCDTTTTGNGAFNWSPSYHIGTDAMYRQTELTKDFSVCCDNKYTLTVWLDVKKIFYGSTQTLDIITQRTTQMGNGEDPAVALTFVNNFSQAFETE